MHSVLLPHDVVHPVATQAAMQVSVCAHVSALSTPVPAQLSVQSTPHLHPNSTSNVSMQCKNASISSVVAYVLWGSSSTCASNTHTCTQTRKHQACMRNELPCTTVALLHIQCKRRTEPVEQALINHNRVRHRADVAVCNIQVG